MTFQGWPAEAFEWFDGLAADNTKQWFHAHRSTYDEAVRGPMQDLVDDLEDEFGPATLSRPNRDTRFSRDKAPYKLEIYARTRRPDGAGCYVQLGAESLFAGGGLYEPDRDRLARVRAAVADDRTRPELEAVVQALGEGGVELMTDGALKTAPRGFPVDHPRIDLLRLRHLAGGVRFPPRAWMGTPAARDRVAAVWRSFGPLLGWLARVP